MLRLSFKGQLVRVIVDPFRLRLQVAASAHLWGAAASRAPKCHHCRRWKPWFLQQEGVHFSPALESFPPVVLGLAPLQRWVGQELLNLVAR